MAISFVNGYLCTRSCDVSKAKRGEDPHPSTDPTKTDSKKKDAAGRDAVLYGGSLSGPSTPDGVRPIDGSSATDPASWQNRKLIVDLLA